MQELKRQQSEMLSRGFSPDCGVYSSHSRPSHMCPQALRDANFNGFSPRPLALGIISAHLASCSLRDNASSDHSVTAKRDCGNFVLGEFALPEWAQCARAEAKGFPTLYLRLVLKFGAVADERLAPILFKTFYNEISHGGSEHKRSRE